MTNLYERKLTGPGNRTCKLPSARLNALQNALIGPVLAAINEPRRQKPAFRICENKDADQLRGNREADQRLCFRYIDSTIPLLSKYEILSLYLSSVAVQPGLCRTWSETPKTGFLTRRLK